MAPMLYARTLPEFLKNTNYIVLDVEYKGTDDNKMEESLMSKAEAEKYFMNLNVDALFVVVIFIQTLKKAQENFMILALLMNQSLFPK